MNINMHDTELGRFFFVNNTSMTLSRHYLKIFCHKKLFERKDAKMAACQLEAFR